MENVDGHGRYTGSSGTVSRQEHACSCTGKPLNQNVQRGRPTFGEYDRTTHMSQANALHFRFHLCIEGIVTLQHFHPCTDACVSVSG